MKELCYIEPYTSLRREGGEDDQPSRILQDLGINLGCSSQLWSRPEETADHIILHTLDESVPMNRPSKHSYVDMYGIPRKRPPTRRKWTATVRIPSALRSQHGAANMASGSQGWDPEPKGWGEINQGRNEDSSPRL